MAIPNPNARDPGDSARDAELVTRLVASDVEALRALMALYWERLSTIAMITTGSPDLACEAVQDAFVQLWEARATLDAGRGVAGYLITVTGRRARDLVRHEHVHAKVAQEMVQQGEEYPAAYNMGERSIESAELMVHVRRALQSLPPRCREIFLLHRQANLSYVEIETLLGISNATIRNQMSRAMQQIARAIADWREGKGVVGD